MGNRDTGRFGIGRLVASAAGAAVVGLLGLLGLTLLSCSTASTAASTGADEAAPPTTVPMQPTPGSEMATAAATASPSGDDAGTSLSPLLPGDGTAVFDVARSTGERLRVVLPASLASGLSSTAETETGLSIIGPAGTVDVDFGSCVDAGGLPYFGPEYNRVGAGVVFEGDAVIVCRSAEQLQLRVETSERVQQAPDLFDVRIVSPGLLHDAALTEVWGAPTDDCRCLPWGPIAFPEVGVVVNATGVGRFTAVDQRDLSERWTVAAGGEDAALHQGPDGVYIAGDEFLRIDAATGEVAWSVPLEADELVLGLHGLSESDWVVVSTFIAIDDRRAPLVRAIDLQTGVVRWTAEGRPASDWKRTAPVAIDGGVVLMDRSEFEDGQAVTRNATLRAYDIDTGELRWTTKLGFTNPSVDVDALAWFDFENGRGLFAQSVDGVHRVDPDRGDVLWFLRADMSRAEFDGTEFDSDGRLALALREGEHRMLVDPDTGQVTEGALCETLHGAEPWITLFTEDLPTPCVYAAEYQNVQLWNKGYDRLVITWPVDEKTVALESDDFHETGPIGDAVRNGRVSISSRPYPMPKIIVLSADESPTAGLTIVDDAVGPVTVGMTLAEASAALGRRITVDPNHLPGPRCWAAFTDADPYSPTFLVRGDGDAASVISEILDPLVSMADRPSC